MVEQLGLWRGVGFLYYLGWDLENWVNPAHTQFSVWWRRGVTVPQQTLSTGGTVYYVEKYRVQDQKSILEQPLFLFTKGQLNTPMTLLEGTLKAVPSPGTRYRNMKVCFQCIDVGLY